MTLTYELWDTTSRNLVAEFGSRDEALSSVREALRTHGHGAVEILALGTEDGDGGGEVIARGADLVALAGADSGGSAPPTAPSAPVRRSIRPGTTGYQPIGGYGFGAMDTFTRIAAMGPRIADLMGPRIADMMMPRLAIPADALMPRLAIPREVIAPLTSGEMFGTSLAGLVSFGRVDWGQYFTQSNDRFMQSLTEASQLPSSSLSSSLIGEWSQIASEIAQLLTVSGRRGEDQILALVRDPQKRFVYRDTGEDDYLGAIDPESDIERGRIIVFKWWLTRDGELVG